MNKLSVFSFLIIFLTACQSGKEQNPNLSLWYQQPADEWMKATPIGNGRLGAMVYGGIAMEKLALNEITMWSGQPDTDQQTRIDGKQRLAAIRKLFFEGKYDEGSQMAARDLIVGSRSFGTHVPIGDLIFRFGHNEAAATGYKRELDLRDAITRVSYQVEGITYRREYFCSNPDNALVIKLSSDKKGRLDFDLGLAMMRKSDSVVFAANNNSLEFSGKVCFPKFGPGGVRFSGKVEVAASGGTVQASDTILNVNGADEVVITLDIRTDYDNPEYQSACRATVEKAIAKGFESIKQDHVTDYKRLFDRVDISLGSSEADKKPTDVRWKTKKEGAIDPGLDALFFQYGRYLLIASSRENSPLPSNLQGIWNDNLACNMGWACDYHLDINIEQNYWLSNIANLHECNEPLFRYIRFLAEHGDRMTQDIYGSPGWAANTIVNAWGYTAPASTYWGLFPTAGAWIASHLWTHYEYTNDKDFLGKTAYPILKSAAMFFLDYMTELPGTNYLVTGPSISPENSFRYNGAEFTLSMMPTCDRVLVYETYMSCIRASEILGVDADFRQSLEEAIKRFPPFKIGKNGALQEWLEDFEEAQPNHRHTTHLLALYPFSQISLVHTPELAEATRKTIKKRLNAPGWEDVEWSRANMINFYARLKDPQEAYNSCAGLLNTFTRENLLTVSPKGIAGAPWDIFIIDGNGAGTSGMAEMLLQNHEGYIEFLPTLPEQWKTGYFKGLCVKGGAETDAEWKNGKITHVTIRATTDGVFAVKLPQNDCPVKIFLNGKRQESTVKSEDIITLTMKKGDVWEVR
jgi:alpha-L-fucosidase 2